MSKSHFALYMEERENAHTLENDTGFICYKFDNDVCIITDIFVHPDNRNLQTGKQFVQKVEEIAKEKEINIMACYADKAANNFDDAILFILKNEYRILNQIGTVVYFKKDI